MQTKVTVKNTECQNRNINGVAKFLIDVYTRICDLKDPNNIFLSDLFHHRNCFPNYIFKYNTTIKESQDLIKDRETVNPLSANLTNWSDALF